MTSASFESSLQVLSLVFNITAVLRLTQLKLYRVYPVFFTYLCVSLAVQTPAVVYGTRSINFLHWYTVLEPIRNILYILVVWELFSGIFRNYRGLRSLSRWVMGVAAAIAPVGLVLTIAASSSSAFSASKFVPKVVRFERGIAFGLVIFIIIMLYFISRYPIKLPRNNVVHCIIYSIWFLADAGILLASSFLPKGYGHIVNDGLALFEIGSYLGWTLLLSKTGEYQETRVRSDISPEHEEVLIGELNAMNDLLLRAGRSISHSRSAGD